MNLTEMITVARQDLHDADATNYRWTDAELTRHIEQAVAELSESIPLLAKAVLPTMTGSREIDISGLSGRIMIVAVEYPLEVVPPEYQQFTIWGDTLTITGGNQPDGNNCSIYYGVPHVVNGQGSTLPEKYTNLAVSGACGYAAVELALYTVNRVNTGGLKTPADLLEWGNQKLKVFRQELKRMGRRNRIRVSELASGF